MQASKAKLGISACLLGAEVRYNGGHKLSRLCSRSLTEHFVFIPVCPKVGIGMSIPREPIRLVGDPHAPRAVGTVDRSRDVTDALTAYGERMANELQGISGYIFMQQSPSCGLERVKVYQEGGRPSEPGRGIFAAAFCARHPDLPVEEDVAGQARAHRQQHDLHEQRRRPARPSLARGRTHRRTTSGTNR